MIISVRSQRNLVLKSGNARPPNHQRPPRLRKLSAESKPNNRDYRKKKLEKETGAAKLTAPRMKMDKETMKRENMPNGDEADNSMDDAMRNAAKQTPSSSPSSSPRRFFTPPGKYARKRLTEYQSLRAEARRKITEEDRARMEAGMIEQAVAESLKTTTVTQACTSAQNTDQPKPLSSLKEPLPHDEKDNDSSPPSQEATTAPEELVYDGTTSAFSNGFS
ncbi:hypothetical protein BKA60DRAFT_600088 [Fusarium oxysporum]|nr:hypothetical protein BKA60DRAFT_600088 [Fusarium oxysporum]